MSNTGQVYQIKVTLDGSKPAIWRRFLVQSDLTFASFHDVLQAVMGWEDCHLYMFRFRETVVMPEPDDEPDDDDDDFLGEAQTLDDEDTRLDELFDREKKCIYTYDFGDGWTHTVQVEKTLEPEEGQRYPVCIGGQRLCPPEDCGGIGGYEELLEIMADPAHPEYEARRDWLIGEHEDGEESAFDPEAFDLDAINEELTLLSEDYAQTFKPPALAQWRKLYELADRIKTNKPWEKLWDGDYIAIHPWGRKEPVYFVTMGRLGECLAVAAFTGNEAIARLEQIRERSEAGMPFAAMGEQDCLICYFGDREELVKEDREVLRELGIKFRGKGQWIYFRSIRRGYAPWHLDAAEADLLAETMPQYLAAYEEIQDQIMRFDDGSFYLREAAPPPSAEPWRSKWMRFDRLGLRYNCVVLTDELYVAKLRKKKMSRLNCELDAVYLPSPIQERKDRRPIFPRLVMLVDSDSGIILDQDLVSSEDLVDSVMDMLEALVMKIGRPRSLHVRDAESEAIVADWCKKLDVRLKTGGSMDAMNEALDGFRAFLRGEED